MNTLPERVEVPLESPPGKGTLLVRVFDVHGQLLSEPERISPAQRRPRDAQPWRVLGWPESVRVLVHAQDALCGLGEAVGAELWARRASEGEFEYEVVEGERYLVGAIGPGFDGSMREIEVPLGSKGEVVDLNAQELGESALISVRVFHRGRELRGGIDDTDDRFAILLQGLAGNELLTVPCELEAPFQIRPPAGDYRLVVEGRAETNSSHGYMGRRRSLGRSEREIHVVAGRDEEFFLEIRDGAKLQVSLAGEPNAADLRAVRESFRFGAWLGPAMDEIDEQEAELLRRSRLAELYVISDGRRREPVPLLQRAMEGTTAGGMHLLNRWPVGATSVSECLPTGRHTLIARMPGGREARAEVELREGMTTPVRLRF